MVIIWQKSAVQDLKDYFKFTKTLHPKQYISELVDYVDILKKFPDLGKNYVEIYSVKIKVLIYKMHKIFYYANDDKIYIVKVAHSHMNEDTILNAFNDFFN